MFKYSTKIAYFYGVSSIILGPAIGLFGLSLTSGGGDCTDAVYGYGGVSFAQRDIEFQQAQMVMSIGAGIMLGIGLLLLGLLIYSTLHTLHKGNFGKHILEYIGPLCLLLVMIAGYSFILVIAQSLECEPVSMG